MAPSPHLDGARHLRVPVGDVTLHAVEMGEGPLVLLLHGFPEFWWSWRHQLPALAAAGFRALALDLRGAGGSDRPRGVAAYKVSRLAGDVVGLLDALGIERARAIVGHDWGGVVAYRVGRRFPGRVEKLAILNAPHPATFARGLLRDWQALRSSYMVPLLVPGLAERAIAARDGALLRRALRLMRAAPVPDEELEPYVQAAREAEWLRGGIAVYRAMARAIAARALVPRLRARRGSRHDRDGSGASRIACPVLVIWGEADPLLAPHLADPPPGAVPHARVVRVQLASHDVMLDAPEEVNALLGTFLRE
jgi:pimeloyl-ACP methyl ester carboxylesterase